MGSKGRVRTEHARGPLPVLILLAGIVGVGLPAPAARAQDAAAARGGSWAYVDLQRALKDSKKGRQAKSAIEEEVGKAQDKLQQMQEDFGKQKAELEKQQPMLEEGALRDRLNELDDLQKSIIRFRDDSLAKLKRREAEETQRLIRELVEIVEKVGAEGGYGMVLERSQGMLYGDPGLDITDRVIDRYDAGGG